VAVLPPPYYKQVRSLQACMSSAPLRAVQLSFCHCCVERKNGTIHFDVKYWEIIADILSASGLSWGCSSQIDTNGRVLYTADAYRKDGKRFTVIADDKLEGFKTHKIAKTPY
jgi:hypothetical protein